MASVHTKSLVLRLKLLRSHKADWLISNVRAAGGKEAHYLETLEQTFNSHVGNATGVTDVGYTLVKDDQSRQHGENTLARAYYAQAHR